MNTARASKRKKETIPRSLLGHRLHDFANFLEEIVQGSNEVIDAAMKFKKPIKRIVKIILAVGILSLLAAK